MLNDENIDILGISVLDTTDSAVIRLIPNYPKDLARLLKSLSISFTEKKVLAVELEKDDSMQLLQKLYCGLRSIFTMFILSCTNPMENRLLHCYGR